MRCPCRRSKIRATGYLGSQAAGVTDGPTRPEIDRFRVHIAATCLFPSLPACCSEYFSEPSQVQSSVFSQFRDSGRLLDWLLQSKGEDGSIEVLWFCEALAR